MVTIPTNRSCDVYLFITNHNILFDSNNENATQDLNDTLEEMDLINIFRTFYPNAEEYPNILVKDIRKAMPILANIYDNQPWKELCITAVGGGIIRDVFIGNIPPKIFDNLVILFIT